MSITKTWNSSFEAVPAGGDDPSGGDDAIRDKAVAVRERAEREHVWSLTDTNSKHGWHREGSARAFVALTAPTAYADADGTAIGGDATIDQGRLWFDSNAEYLPKVYDGGWKRYMREIARISIQGALAAGTDVVPPIIFPRACKLLKISARLGTGPTTQSLVVDLNLNGSSSIFGSNGARVAFGVSSLAATSEYFSVSLAADEYLTMDIDQVGGTTKGSDLSLTVEVAL